MKVLMKASTWPFEFVTILPFQWADTAPFKIQTARWWASECTRTGISNAKWKCLSHHFIRCWIRTSLFFHVCNYVFGRGWSISQNEEGRCLSKLRWWKGHLVGQGRGKSSAGPSRNWCSLAKCVLLLSKDLPHSTINVCALGRIRRTKQEEDKGFVWLGGLLHNSTAFL